jgi:cell division septation protein DedD
MRLGCSCARSTAAVNPEPRERRREESEGSDWDDDESDDEALRAWESARASESGATTLVDAPAAATMSDDDDDVEDVFATPRAVIAPPDAADEREEIEDAIASTSAPTAPPPSVVVATRSDPRDAYGFDLSDLDGAGAAARERCDARAARRNKRWEKYRKKGDAAFANLSHRPSGRLKRLIRKGVPKDLRAAVWMATSGARERKDAAPRKYYGRLQSLPVDGAVEDQIRVDLHRTFPENDRWSNPDSHRVLERVLLSYAKHNPSTGYCQGMNFVAAFLLLVVTDEEDAFWVLCALLDDISPPDIHAADIRGTIVEYGVLHDVVAKIEPKVGKHLEACDVELVMIASKWLLCFFTESFPAETSARVLDAMFSEGFKVWFRVVMSMLMMNKKELTRVDNAPEIMQCLGASFRAMHDRDALMAFAFKKVRVDRSFVEKCRAKQEKAQAAERLHREGSERALHRMKK